MQNVYRRLKQEDFRYCRTTCGVISFIVCFLATFFSFTVADETGNKGLFRFVGALMLVLTILCFLCVYCESQGFFDPVRTDSPLVSLARLDPEQSDEFLPEPDLAPQQQPELPAESRQTRQDTKSVGEVSGMPPGDSENVSEIQTLGQMAKSELFSKSKETKVKNGQEFQDRYSSTRVGASGFELYSSPTGSSKNIGSTPSDSPLGGLSALSLPGSTSSTIGSSEIKQKGIVSAVLSKLSLDDSIKYATLTAKHDNSSSDSEGGTGHN